MELSRAVKTYLEYDYTEDKEDNDIVVRPCRTCFREYEG